jgi:para-aminobenzoate synthetase/4-amino-4-deoxychorismate lyase
MSVYERLAESGSLWFETACPKEPCGDSFFFSNPIDVLTLLPDGDPGAYFSMLEERLHSGFCLAGWLGYEAGYGFEPALSGSVRSFSETGILGWFGVYETAERHSRPDVLPDDVSAASFRVSNLAFEFPEKEYLQRIRRIRKEIGAGNVYQVNFTGRYRFDFQGSAAGLYAAMKQLQPSPYTAYLNTGDRVVLSFSPELFFRRNGPFVETMPMKGTAPRGSTPADDQQLRTALTGSGKNRAENLMIVDLLRNDLGRICLPGSVSASALFSIHSYPTLHQMVSTVRGELRRKTSLYDLFRALFPSGSITGAPKIRAMNLIRELEKSPRGVYSGAVGFMMPDSSMVFNVAIRTVEISGESGVYGTGGGIVWDSDPLNEYHECMLKAKILSGLEDEKPELFETILWNGGYLWLEEHFGRLEASANVLGYGFDRDHARDRLSLLETHEFRKDCLYRVRLSLDSTGGVSVRYEQFIPGPPDQTLRLCLASERARSSDPLLYHKTNRRELYDRYFRKAFAAGYHEVLFMNERHEITEGAISNIVLCCKGRFVTPPEASGLLNGVFRRYFLRTRPWVKEKRVTLDDLRGAESLFLCNALRGLRHAVFCDEVIEANG